MKKSTLVKLLCVAIMAVMVFSLVSCGKETVTLKLELNGGELEGGSTIEYKEGDTVESLPMPTKEMGLFLGWYDRPTDEVGAKEVKAPFEIEKDTTLYAWWLGVEFEGTNTDIGD